MVSNRSAMVTTMSRPEIVEHGRQFRQAEAGGLGRGHQVLTLQDHVNLTVDLEAFLLDDVDGIAVTVEQRRGGDHKLKLQAGMIADGFQRGAHAGHNWDAP